MPKRTQDRELLVLTRKEGVRPENPLFKIGGRGNNKYFPASNIRTPALRKEADDLLSPHAAAVQKQNKYGTHRY
jgi:hypothetical protein